MLLSFTGFFIECLKNLTNDGKGSKSDRIHLISFEFVIVFNIDEVSNIKTVFSNLFFINFKILYRILEYSLSIFCISIYDFLKRRYFRWCAEKKSGCKFLQRKQLIDVWFSRSFVPLDSGQSMQVNSNCIPGSFE